MCVSVLYLTAAVRTAYASPLAISLLRVGGVMVGHVAVIIGWFLVVASVLGKLTGRAIGL